MGRRICLLRSSIKGDHYFPDVIMALQFYLVAYPFLRGKRKSTRIYDYAYWYVIYRTRTVLQKWCIFRSVLYGPRRQGESCVAKFLYHNDIIYCISSSVGKLSILKFRTERAPNNYNDTTATLFNTEKIIIS